MDTMTSTATKAVSGTKLFIATMAMFGAGAIALAAVPAASPYGGCVDGDNNSTASVGYNKFANHQLFYKANTTYSSGSKTDYCYTFSNGKTYLMEGVSSNGSFQTWQKNCAELNPANPGANFKCVDGACVNQAPCYNISGNGQRIKVSGNPAVWYLDSGVRHNFTKSEVYKSWFIDYSGVQEISPIAFDKYKEGGVVCMNTMTSAAKLDIFGRQVAYTDASISPNSSNVEINKYQFVASGYDIKINDLPFMVMNGDGIVDNAFLNGLITVKLVDANGNTLGTKLVENKDSVVNFTNLNYVIAKGTSQMLSVKLDVGNFGSELNGKRVKLILMPVENINAVDTVTALKIGIGNLNVTNSDSQPFTLSVTKLEISGKQTTYTNTNILPNTSNVEINKYRFTASGSSVKINELPFMITNGNGVVESAFSNGLITIKLIDANGNTLGTKLVENNDSVVNFTNLNYVIADGAPQMLSVKFDVGNFGSEINGKNIKIILMPVENINAVGALTGSMIETSNLNVLNSDSQPFTFVKTVQPAKLTVLSTSLPSNVLLNGVDIVVGKFNLTASTVEDVKVNKIIFTFLASLPTTSSSIQTNNWELRSFPEGILMGSGSPSGSQIIFNDLNATIQKGSTLVLQLYTFITGITDSYGYYSFKSGILSVEAVGNNSGQIAQIVGVPVWAPVLSN